jgi:hypothetical protein
MLSGDIDPRIWLAVSASEYSRERLASAELFADKDVHSPQEFVFVA